MIDINNLTDEQKTQIELSKKIAESFDYLKATDHKMLSNYVPKTDEDLEAIIAKRNETREFIRNSNA